MELSLWLLLNGVSHKYPSDLHHQNLRFTLLVQLLAIGQNEVERFFNSIQYIEQNIF